VDSEDYTLAHAYVAISDSPAGPFKYIGSLRPDWATSKDMTIFMDDSGKADDTARQVLDPTMMVQRRAYSEFPWPILVDG
jgi:hypothetical protein